ncbi:LCP family protein [Streptomyces ovatisporus]|uniref:LCP family protein n=1 Tax=Streptomyces ovatisporus TaxID=1128682 RepID=A0ABV9AB79_9ACTN
MKDPHDQWAEGGRGGARAGSRKGRTAPRSGGRRRRDAFDTGEYAVGDPVNVVSPTRPGGPVTYPPRPGEDRQGPKPPTGEVIQGEAVARRTTPLPAQESPAAAGRPGGVPHGVQGPGAVQPHQPGAVQPGFQPGAVQPGGPGSPAFPPGGGGPVGPGGFSSRFGPEAPRAGRPRRRRPLRRAAVVLLVTVLAGSVGTYAWAETKLQRNVDLDKFDSRPPAGKGTNYLIVGSDSREGLSEEDRKRLNTGVFGGRRTDSMILLHKGANGTTMVSFPRDSWVTLPGYTHPSTGKTSGPVENKLNAAFSQGGPELLISTIEQNTGLRIDHYAEIGFAGFVNIVDAVGGVPMCVDRNIKDKDSGANLRKGCQNLDGAEALAFVRQRKQEAQGDLGRTQNQQKFLSALAKKAADPDTALDPGAVYPAVSAGLDTLVVDQGMSLKELTTMLRSVQGISGGGGKRINVPTTGPIRTSKGDAVAWNTAQAEKLFGQLKRDQKVTINQR